jgi:chromosome segregation ATPase
MMQIADAARIELAGVREALEQAQGAAAAARRERDELRAELESAHRERDRLRSQLEIAQRDLQRAGETERAGATRITGLERLVADAARFEVAAARAQSMLAASTEELAALRNELDGQRMRVNSQSADAQRLTRERDQALAAVEVERARADAAVAAVRDDARRSRKIVGDDTVNLTTAKLQRQIDDLRAEVRKEQEGRKELEELLDENAANLEQTIQDYEDRLDALGAGVEDKRPAKPKKTRQG